MEKYIFSEEVEAEPAVMNMWKDGQLVTVKGYHVRNSSGQYYWLTKEQFDLTHKLAE